MDVEDEEEATAEAVEVEITATTGTAGIEKMEITKVNKTVTNPEKEAGKRMASFHKQ